MGALIASHRAPRKRLFDSGQERELANLDNYLDTVLYRQISTAVNAEFATVPAGVLNTVGEALVSEQVRANDLVMPMQHPRLGEIQVLGFPTTFDRTPCDIRRPPPDIGQHTDEVRRARKF